MRANVDQPDIHEILQSIHKSPLLKLTLDQLRIYVGLCEAKSQEAAATLLECDASTVRRDRDALERRVKPISGERVFIDRHHRGGDIHLTSSGVLVEEHARQILFQIFLLIQELKRPRPVRLGLTNYMIEIAVIRKILEQAQAKLGTSLTFRHIASDDVIPFLKAHLVDFVFSGARAINEEARSIDEAIEFTPLIYTRFGLLSNYEIQPTKDGRQLIHQERAFLLPPTHGIFLDVLRTFLNDREIEELAGPRCDNIHFALDLLRFKLQPKACLIVDQEVARVAARHSPTKLHFLAFEPTQALKVGVFRLKERAAFRSRRTHGDNKDPVHEPPSKLFEQILESFTPRQASHNKT